jgi:ABC-type branched-subunit amino acid transport system substrate-binding protein
MAVTVLLAVGCGDEDDADEADPGGAGSAEDGDDGDGGGGDICAAADAGPVVVVHMTEIAGDAPLALDDYWNGSSMAADDINEQCGEEVVDLQRLPTDFTVEDAEAKLLEAQEQEPAAIIGPGSSSQVVVNPIVDEGGIPMLWPVGTGEGVLDGENGSEWAWMSRPINDTQGYVWGQYLVEQGKERVWLECVQTQLGVSGCGGAAEVLEANGVEIVGRNDAAFDESDFTSSVVDLEAGDADAAVIAQFPEPQLAFTQQLEENDLLDQVTPFGGSSTELVFQAMSPEAQAATLGQADCNPREDDPELNGRYEERYDGAVFTTLAAASYDAVFLIVDAVARTGGTDPDSVAEGLSTTEWEGLCQDYFDNGNHALAHKVLITSFADGVITTEATYELDDDGTGLAE